ncbi:MAG: pantoate--beta-alanine ligase [Protaetiibacter sp.]
MTQPQVVTTIAELRSRLTGGSVALVPTMGALHAGHLALVERATQLADTVVVSVFVNPLQFGAGEDLERYPRDLAADLATLADRGVAYVFAPSVAEMYPHGAPQITVRGGTVAELFEGASRPGHFDGMLTVVAKLLGIVRPEAAVFGQKDAQQLWLVQRMVADLDIATRIEPVPTVREGDGLALSSRNRYLSPVERAAAPVLRRALEAAASAGSRGADAARSAAREVLAQEPLVTVDYLEVVDPRSFEPVDDGHHGPARAIVAARLGSTRLIDNDALTLH